MPGQTLTTAAFVIEKRPPTDAFQGFGLFSEEHGSLLAFQRVSKRATSLMAVPDLFDEVEVMLESSNQGRTWFVKDLRITARRTAIGRSYESLLFASALASVISRNPVHEESRENVALLLRTAFDAFASAERPDIVYLKSLYVFARDEGYPVKQEWIPSIPEGDRLLATGIINLPVAGQHAAPIEVARIRRSLEDYLGGNTEIVIP